MGTALVEIILKTEKGDIKSHWKERVKICSMVSLKRIFPLRFDNFKPKHLAALNCIS